MAAEFLFGVGSRHLWESPDDGGSFNFVAVLARYLAGPNCLPASSLADLQNLTTYPPVVTNGWITNDFTFTPQVLRNTGVPDLGYHYAPID